MKLSLFAATMLLFASTAFGQMIQKGDFSGNVNSEGWSLNGGSGNRVQTMFVKFAKPFAKTPMVSLSITSYDGAPGKDGNVRVAVKADQITRDGFAVKISTWGDSRVAGVEGSYVAFTNK